MQSSDKEPYHEPLPESEKRQSSKYGMRPYGGLLDKRSKERTYFDSGDFALSAAERVTDNGAIETGREHPHRDSISHPYAPIPAASNVDKDANEDSYKSPLIQQADSIHGEPTKEEGLDKPVSHDG
ncbi:hypothetical protein P168DRAFT_306731 [Aspergillus campestris IBT 28561]|uniref:mRNA stability protein n=1 Tax=Aspergillus campestris (strain IBT 28561) TaxID=1392248 RepID=A0A2I1CVB9_ASPC2|nr:uncharacterized protein P168DRAFT_306731 [Aspergillus campestris IBT 28561]PKY01580.1 hypothetical protein P168DRAFT_306731 [Aspergillus campestris IBT 28561]